MYLISQQPQPDIDPLLHGQHRGMYYFTSSVPALPNVCASVAREDWSDKYDDMPGAPECWVYGYDDGQNIHFF
jgi:hypothetical protein